MDADITAILAKTPLAEAAWLLWNEVLPDAALDDFYDRHRGSCYRRAFSFADLVYLVNDALCQHGGRARPTLDRHADSERRPASVQAFYGKLRRLPLALSEAFLAEGSDRLRPRLARQTHANAPTSLRDFRALVIDGKTFKYAAKRLGPVRGRAGRGLGGKGSWRWNSAPACSSASPSIPTATPTRPNSSPDSCRPSAAACPAPTCGSPTGSSATSPGSAGCAASGDHCVLRLHPKSTFAPDPLKPARAGTDRDGRAWTDAAGELRSQRQGAAAVRLVTLTRPGKEPLRIVTDLIDADRYPANDLLELYRRRWGVEEVFQEVSEVFHLRHLIGSHPQAIAFQAALCMMLYNLLQAIRGIVAEARDRRPPTVSTRQIFYDLHRELVVLHHPIPPDRLAEALRERAAATPDLRAYLLDRLRTAWQDRWTKCPPKKRHAIPAKHKRGTAGHFSIHKVLVENEEAKDV